MGLHQNRLSVFLLASALVGMAVIASSVVHAATLTVVNNDGPGEGFNDPTPKTPVGGNPGTTLGAQRLIAFQRAADIWGGLISSSVTIRIGATFDPLSCSASSAILGSAGPTSVFRDFAGALVATTWYPVALANALHGSDLDPGDVDLVAQFNSALGTTCPFPRGWYYGLDGNAGSDIDFVTVLLHEMGHGLGFLTFVGSTSGAKLSGFNDTYMLNLEDHGASPADYPSMTNAQRVAASKDTGNLHWVGAHVRAASGILTAGKVGDHVRMFAPNPQQPGSSVSHWDTALTPNQLMEPSYTVPLDPELELPLLQDIGWTLLATPPLATQCSAPGQPILLVPGTYATIQGAIDAATDGSCILVAPGTYSVNLHITGRYVELKAASSDPTQTILDGGHFNSVVIFQNVPYNPSVPYVPAARISGFTIQNGQSIEGQGGGITLANQAEVIVANNIIKNNASAVDGGGILVYNRSHSTIINNTMTANLAARFGGGLFVVGDGSPGGGSHPIIYNNTITGNIASGSAIPNGGGSGGGIFVDSSSAPYIIGNTLSGNTAPFAGGAITLRSGVGGFVQDNTITGNAAAHGGGVHIETDGSGVVVSNNTISNNNATFSASFSGSGFGGGISVYAQSQPMIFQNTISGNTATYGGGGIVVAEGANAVIRANTISGNIVNGNPIGSPIGPPPGGGIYVSQATASIVNNVIYSNSSGYGGGIGLLGGAPTTVTIENNTVVKNVATVVPASATGAGGGGLFVPLNSDCTPATNTTVSNNIFDLNTGFQIFEACRGGATYNNNLVNNFSSGMYFNYNSQAVTNIGTFNASVAGSANISGSTGFANAAGNDFRLTGSSAAIDLGTAIGAPPDDFANMDRPAGAADDIGAYEFTGQTVAKNPVYRFFSLTKTVHFYTQSKAERDLVMSTYPYRFWRFEGIAYQTYPLQVANTVPVHRFFSFTSHGHFYTTSLCEMYKDCQVHPPGDPLNIYPDNVWHYEGIAFDVYPTQVVGSTPVHRFFSPVVLHHFYTNSEAEKNGLIANPTTAQWQYEGIGWYVPSS